MNALSVALLVSLTVLVKVSSVLNVATTILKKYLSLVEFVATLVHQMLAHLTLVNKKKLSVELSTCNEDGMNYHKYHPVDVVNGEGTRCTLFVAGCEHNCRGCYNKSTLNPNSGHLFTQELEDKIIADLQDTRIMRRGLSLSGGDPLHPANIDSVLQLVKRVKNECPTKDIWLWTGYTFNNLTNTQKEIVDMVDVLIDGKFEQELYDPSLEWRGSSNQIIHRFKVY